MATKDEIYGIVAAYGLGRVLPQGSTRAAARAAINGIVKSGKIVIPAAARAAPSIARTGLNLHGSTLTLRQHYWAMERMKRAF